MEQQPQQQAPLLVTPRKRKEAVWWDIFSPCKDASDSEDDDVMSYADHDPNNSIIENDPQTPASKSANGPRSVTLQVEKDAHDDKSPLKQSPQQCSPKISPRSAKMQKESGSQKDVKKDKNSVTKKLFGGDEKCAKKQCSEEQNEVPSLVDETNNAASSSKKSTNDNDSATFKEKKVGGDDNANTKNLGDDVSTNLGTKSGQIPSVPKQQLGPRQTTQEQCLSYLKLPAQIASNLLSAWVAMIIIRIVMIIFVKFFGDNQLFDGFNAPGIY